MVTRVSALLLCLLLASTTSGFAQLTRTVDAGGGLYLQQVFGRALIHEPSGASSELSLPPGAKLQQLGHLDSGWFAAGVAEASDRTDLFLLRSEAGVRSPLAPPPNPSGQPLRHEPAPLVDKGQLAGLAWIEGSAVRQTAVYASLWSGADWAQAELVSPVGPGTQIALRGTVLADGTWLLVWSAWDGNDDEIVWSRRVDGRWSQPRPLHRPNDHPDIVPTIVSTGRGALVAWSSSDGSTYRVRLAAFEDVGWRELELPFPAGSVRPALTATEEGALLLYRTVVPPSWTLLGLDQRGTPLRRAVLEHETTFRPGLAPRAGRAPAFEWPGEEVATPMRTEVEWQAEP